MDSAIPCTSAVEVPQRERVESGIEIESKLVSYVFMSFEGLLKVKFFLFSIQNLTSATFSRFNGRQHTTDPN